MVSSRYFFLRYCSLGLYFLIFASLIVDLFVRINRISVHWYWNLSPCVLEKFLWAISKPDIQISSPAGFWKVMARVTVGCSDLFASIYWFAWSKISFKFFVQALFCWFLTCVYFIYCIVVHWSWNLSLSVLETFLRKVSKPGIQLWLPCRFVGGRD